jgi:hypothetical protein
VGGHHHRVPVRHLLRRFVLALPALFLGERYRGAAADASGTDPDGS